MESSIRNNLTQPDEYKPIKGNAMITRSDSYETVEPRNQKVVNKNLNMESSTRNNLTQPDEYKLIKGNAMITRSDSYETVEPRNQKVVNKNFNFINSIEYKTLCEKLGKIYLHKFKKQCNGFSCYKYDDTSLFVCFLSRNLLMEVTTAKFSNYVAKYKDHAVLKGSIVNYDKEKVLIVSERQIRPQMDFVAIKNFLVTAMTGPFVLLDTVKDMIHKITSKATKLLVIDIIALLISLRDGYFSVGKLLSALMNLYTLHERYMDIWNGIHNERLRPQAGASISDLLFGFAALGLPSHILDAIKTFTTITGKRIFDSTVFIEGARVVLESLITIVEWMAEPLPMVKMISTEVKETIVSFIKKVGSSIFLHEDIKKVCDFYTEYVSGPQILFDPAYRAKIMNFYNKLKSNGDFQEYIANGNNKYFITTWRLFIDNVVKSCEAFDTSGRDEPICIVFEGEAGSGKSRLMNAFVALLAAKGMSTICHSVPAAEDGKDFYDDYENQAVFVMDDVGQQGNSQWRYLINYISPVKYPLPCATASKKNTKFFNSKVVLCTTNHFMSIGGFTKTDCISEPEALYRRAHVIKVTRAESEEFAQVLSYYKYDHIGSKKWESKFINHNAVGADNVKLADEPLDFTTAGKENKNILALNWVYRIFSHIEKTEELNRSNLVFTDRDYQSILRGEVVGNDVFSDVPSESARGCATTHLIRPQLNIAGYLSTTYEYINDKVINSARILNEFVSHYTSQILSFFQHNITKAVQALYTLVMENPAAAAYYTVKSINGLVFAAVMGRYLINFFHTSDTIDLSSPEFKGSNIKDNGIFKASLTKERIAKSFIGPQAGDLKTEYEEWINTIRKGCKTIVMTTVKNGITYESKMQCVVSGKRILVPAHFDLSTGCISLYATWQHYLNKHCEIENVRVKLIKRYLTTDMAVWEIIGTIPLYKLNKALFSAAASSSSVWYLINSAGYYEVVYDYNCVSNEEVCTYGTIPNAGTLPEATQWRHEIDTGYFYTYSVPGGCGTVLAAPGAGIIGFHVAGGDSAGFAVRPSVEVASEIRDLMMSAPAADNFDLDDKIIPNFSGVRVRYTQPLKQVRATHKTTFVKSVLHRDCNPEMEKLISDVESTPIGEYTRAPVEVIDKKAPPNFRSRGTAAKTLKELSLKSFSRQGFVSNEEIEFIKDYMRSILIPFDDLSDQETAFGGKYAPAMNKDSSNGYGCLPGKEAYIDFENKVIKPEMYKLINDIKQQATEKKFDYNYFMCRESFKDELRGSAKVNDPRTFRVMPLGNIWWTKKIFGQLLKHFKDTRMKYGISVGYNPYIDSHELANKLKLCKETGDADFKKWDGSVLAVFMQSIFDVMKEFYRGEHLDVIDWLCATISYAFVNVNDEIWATTHGLPSGTWLTLLLNCMLNKALTALVIYRNKPNPQVGDVHKVIDFVMGDDKVFGSDEESCKYFNLLTIKEVAESLGMTVTNGDKSAIESSSQPFDKLTYVKRHFRFHPVLKRTVGVLSLDTIFNTLQWFDSNKDGHEAMIGKMRSMQVEAYLHSEALFSQLTRVFSQTFPYEALFDREKVINILNYDDGYEFVMGMQGKFIQY